MVCRLPCRFFSGDYAADDDEVENYTDAEWQTWCEQDENAPVQSLVGGVQEFHSAFMEPAKINVDIVRDQPYLVAGVTLPTLIQSAPTPSASCTLPSPPVPITSGGHAAASSRSGQVTATEAPGQRKTPDHDPAILSTAHDTPEAKRTRTCPLYTTPDPLDS